MFLSLVRCYLQVFLGLYRANREISNKKFSGKGGKRQGKGASHMHNAVNLSLKKFSESSNTQRLPRQAGRGGGVR